MADDLSAALAEIRERRAIATMAAPLAFKASAGDVPRLLAAVEAVLKLHARQETPMRSYDLDLRCPVHREMIAPRPSFTEIRDCPDCTYRERHPCTHCREDDWPCPTVQAVTAPLTGEGKAGG